MKMNCHWTEKISLLIDGELAPEEARAVESHAADCHACQLAREDFLLLRHQINSFHAEPNLIAQRQALKNILGGAARGDSATAAASRDRRARLLGAFALPRLSPALAALVALVVVGIVIGVLMLRRPERVEVATKTNDNARVNSNLNSNTVAAVTPAPVASPEKASVAETPRTHDTETNKVESATSRSGAGEQARRAVILNTRKPRVEEASEPKIVKRLKLPLTPKLAVDPTELVETQLASISSQLEPSDSGTARHVEQAQQLLRSFRNARVEGQPTVSDIAYEKRRSRELLYRNIVLRREAASKGNVSVESLLDNLEPILIDIANLPDRPAQEDMRSITERMKKKNIVAMLQVANASRMY